jgi:2-keto-4-pentenoate hydratase
VIGSPSTVAPDALDTLHGRITHNGQELGNGPATALLGHPLEVLAWLAGSGAAHEFGGLKAGQVILCGSVTPPFWLSAPGTVTVDFGPLGAVSTSFA